MTSDEPDGDEPPGRGRWRWWHPQRIDLLLVIGAVSFLYQALVRPMADPTVVFGSLALMGLPVVQRIDQRK